MKCLSFRCQSCCCCCCIRRRHMHIQTNHCCCVKRKGYLYNCFAFVWQYFRDESVRREILRFENGQPSSVQLQRSAGGTVRMQPEKFRLPSLGDRHRLSGSLRMKKNSEKTLLNVRCNFRRPCAVELENASILMHCCIFYASTFRDYFF